MTKRYLTAVLEYEEGAELPQAITRAFADGTPLQGATITAVSLEDEISRVEQLENEGGRLEPRNPRL